MQFLPTKVIAHLGSLSKLRLAILLVSIGCDSSISHLDQTTVEFTGSMDTSLESTSDRPRVDQSTGERNKDIQKAPLPQGEGSEFDTGTRQSSKSTDSGHSSQQISSPTVEVEDLSSRKVSLELTSASLMASKTYELDYDYKAPEGSEIIWSQQSGPGSLQLTKISDKRLRLSADLDGTYEFKGQIIRQGQPLLEKKKSFTWDTRGPAQTGSLYTFADSPTGTDTRIDNDREVYLSWDPFSETLSPPIVYDLSIYSGELCSGAIETTALNLSTYDYRYEVARDGTFAFKITARDQLGNTTETPCSPPITIDTEGPPSLIDAKAHKGPRVQTLALQLTFPNLITDYSKLVVVRGSPVASGLTPNMPESCNSGTKIVEKTNFTPSEIFDFVDDIGKAGFHVSYRICFYDKAGNKGSDILLSQDSQLGGTLTSKEHTLFTTSEKFKGNLNYSGSGLSGLELADARCQESAANSNASALKSEVKWRAILSDDGHDVQKRLIITGVVKDQALQSIIAQSRSDLWDGSINSSIFFNENGGNEGFVWTGSDAYGLRHSSHCANWTLNSGGQAKQGDSFSSTDFNWLSTDAPFASSFAACSEELGLYCMSQPPSLSWSDPTYQLQNPTGILWTIPEISLAGNRKLEIWRIMGASSPDSSCTVRSTETKLATLSGDLSPQTYTDPAIVSGTTYSYRFCIIDELGNILTSRAVSGVNVP